MIAKANAKPDHNLPVLTVGELSLALKRTLEGAFPFVRVRGEISGFKRAASGHLYFSLKDADAVLDGVCWRGTAGRLGLAPEDGMEVVAAGRVSTYASRSRYQIVVEHMELAGEGALLKLLEERRRKLAAEGLFDEARKQAIPFLPDVIGVVTSPTGAVLRDILHRLADRFPRRVLLWPVLVQGEGAAEQVAAAIEGFNRLGPGGAVPRPDVLIVARGGGSLEDLWAFNEEAVVRAVAAGAIPLISAIGHETDTTLIDFAADRRAPTPTAAAEMAVPVLSELLARLIDDSGRLVGAANRAIADGRMRLEGLARGLPNLRRLVEDWTQRLDEWSERLANSARAALRTRQDHVAKLGYQLQPRALELHIKQSIRQVGELGERLARAIRRKLAQHEERKDTLYRLLNNFSYQRVLERGFVLVRDAKARPVTSAGALKPGMELALRFHDGDAAAVAAGRPKGGKGRDSGGEDGEQGSLL